MTWHVWGCLIIDFGLTWLRTYFMKQLCSFWSLPCQHFNIHASLIYLRAKGSSHFGLFGFHAASVFFLLHLTRFCYPVWSNKACSNTDMDSKDLWPTAGPTCLCLGLCHTWLPTWCLQELLKKRQHQKTLHTSLSRLNSFIWGMKGCMFCLSQGVLLGASWWVSRRLGKFSEACFTAPQAPQRNKVISSHHHRWLWVTL